MNPAKKLVANPARMRLSFTKKTDGAVILRCTRADGSVTWQKQKGHFFAYHDLTHYAVETTLGLRQAFLGLLASGWDMSDFGENWRRERIINETDDQAAGAGLAELLAGAFDLERINGLKVTADAFNAHAKTYYSIYDAIPPRAVTEEEVRAVRTLRERLFADWERLPPGETLELSF